MGSTQCLPVKLASGFAACYPQDYGSECKEWDVSLPEACADREGRTRYKRPDWCKASWCYVEVKDECSPAYPSYYFKGLSYSYATCGVESSFQDYIKKQGKTAGDLAAVLEGYITSTRESAIASWTGGSTDGCSPPTGCNCASCIKRSSGPWATQTVDLTKTAMIADSGQKGLCLTEALHTDYEHVAAKEYAAASIAYMYFGLQTTGALVNWPAMSWCPKNYDARFRPWYSAAASGPKDVILIIDTSGSMSGGREKLARAASKAVVETLVDVDYAAIVGFSSKSFAYKDTMEPMTPAEQDAMNNWIDENIGADGGTNFKEGFSNAFDILSKSRAAGKTAKCKAIMLFLSDGDPSDWCISAGGIEDCTASYRWLKQMNERVGDAVIFTYGLGSGLSPKGLAINKRIACENRGIFHKVGDDDDLMAIMSKYYNYLAVGTDSAKIRWREYTDSATSTQLLSGCLPAFDRRSVPRQLIGVSCIDINLLVELDTFKASAGYDAFASQVVEDQKYCAPFRLTQLDLQLLRGAVSPSAMCDTESGHKPVVCGDGVRDGGPGVDNEGCDDGNTQDGDGCSSTCQVEKDWTCPPNGYHIHQKYHGYDFIILELKGVYCYGKNLDVTDPGAPGQATSYPYCRENADITSCGDYCLSTANCTAFNFYQKAWGLTDACCFRSKASTQEFHGGTSCFEMLPDAKEACQDSPGFRDERHYRCHEWVGYPCESAATEWGYSAAGHKALQDNCRSSCGICSGRTCHPTCSVHVTKPADCPDCKGTWGPWDKCSQISTRGSIVDCLQVRSYNVIKPSSGGEECPHQQGAEEFRLVNLFTIGNWGECMRTGGDKLSCGDGVKRRPVTCMLDESLCAKYTADVKKEIECFSLMGCEYITGPWSDCGQHGKVLHGRDHRIRDVTCELDGEDENCPGEKPIDVEECVLTPSPSVPSPSAQETGEVSSARELPNLGSPVAIMIPSLVAWLTMDS
eukprot:gnl/MRDRNA2_/MRDRNA2_78262_c0_seq1.p1 gnl/MRDRNA2_/MRDRNA2_78262_c0~~gnl/MRDRNA2_/MRDRNA2_78262_c0_seq1.p1  ORF type:complete len:972 (+),score=136.46 gnl/MRDRNA2_/MRDRNA2_78262_c0_seq1:94-3009(+)